MALENLCLHCQNPVTQTPGKRPKNFCDSNCRSKYWQKNKRIPKTVRRVTYDKVVAENRALREEIERLKLQMEQKYLAELKGGRK